MSDALLPSRESWHVTDLTIPGWEYFCFRRVYSAWPGKLHAAPEGFSADQERKIPGNPEIPEVFPSWIVQLISDIPESRLIKILTN